MTTNKMHPLHNPAWKHDMPIPHAISENLQALLMTMNDQVQIPSLEDFFRRYPVYRPTEYHGKPTAIGGEPLPTNGDAHHPRWQAATI